MPVEFAQQFIECCDSSMEELLRLQGQIPRIIEIKQNIVKGNAGGIALSATKDAVESIENMQKISFKLDSSVEKIKTIREQAEIQFREGMGLQKKIKT